MNRAVILIMMGATLWGTISIFVKNLYEYGFTPMEVVTIRAVTAAIILVAYLFFSSPKSLRLKQIADLKYFIGTGIFSIIFFNYCMFKTMEIATIPISAALLYTAPAFVIVLSFFLFQEQITVYKLLSLLLTLIGTALVVGLLPLNVGSIPIATIFIGLGSGLGYALYSIFSKFALTKYSSLTVTTYTFVVAALTLLPFFPFKEKGTLLIELEVLLYGFGLGFFPTAIAYIIYTYGLFYTEASKAAILSTMEPVVATLIGIFIFTEPFSLIQIVGMTAILTAVILIQLDKGKPLYKKKVNSP